LTIEHIKTKNTRQPDYAKRNFGCGWRVCQAIKLCLGRGTHRAHISASAAVNARVFVNHVRVITLRDGADRALCLAGTAIDASIGNFESHSFYLPCDRYLCVPQ